MARKKKITLKTTESMETVGDLAAFLATLDQSTVLTKWGMGGLFNKGIAPDIITLRKVIDDPTYAVMTNDPICEKWKLGDEFPALAF
jgi:hypothetical protein